MKHSCPGLEVVRHSQLDWTPGSPTSDPSSGDARTGVWRKVLAARGPEHDLVLCALVRWDRGLRLSPESRGAAEEILVLDGTLWDEQDALGRGSYVLTSPREPRWLSTPDGCLLFVRSTRLEQDRGHTTLDTSRGVWESRGFAGARRQFLHLSEGAPEQMWLTRLAAGVQAPTVEMPHGEELFVVEGAFTDEFGSFSQYDWLRFAPGMKHAPRTDSGCLLYVARDTRCAPPAGVR